ncbi:glycosyltransferase family 2 protein [Candidatus Saccharibacteria bacterium]|nr:glycosyltransferase family 2 protein [Candidatus Saccharibacteria bacterium]
MKLLVFSICKDEAPTIGQVLDGVPPKISGISQIEKWVIDDGSTDKTAAEATKHGANVIQDGNSKRLAFRFREALEIAMARNADIMVNIDGDLQFNPADIPKLVEPIVNDEADFVAADRFSDKTTGRYRRPAKMSRAKYWGNRLGARVVSKLSRHEFHDVTCGFRAYNRKAMFALNIDGTYTYTQESFQVLAMKRLRILAIPIDVDYHSQRKSRVVQSVLHFIAISAVSILRSYRDFAPLRFFGWLGAIPFALGLISTTIFFAHYFVTGSFSPYKFLGFAGVYLLTLGILFWGLGLVADMLARMLNNQEKILEHVKKHRFEKKE